MEIGFVGLGRMGGGMTHRLLDDGHTVFGYAPSELDRDTLEERGGKAATSLEELVSLMSEEPRVVWWMVPAGQATEDTIDGLAKLLAEGDIVVDGGNTNFRDDQRRAKALEERGIQFIDAGTSGGVWGYDVGYCLMVGGPDPAVERLAPVLTTLAPPQGWLHCGPVGAGHFVKMVHNGIEYGLMAAYAEGLNVLANADAGRHVRDADAETAPLEHPERYRYSIDVAEVAELWRRGSVVSSWLLDLTSAALHDAPTLEGFSGRVSDSGEGRWTAVAAIEMGVPTPVLTSALSSRFSSRGEDDFANKVLSAMRKEFGGHVEKPS